jgi:hypothetical protein
MFVPFLSTCFVTYLGLLLSVTDGGLFLIQYCSTFKNYWGCVCNDVYENISIDCGNCILQNDPSGGPAAVAAFNDGKSFLSWQYLVPGERAAYHLASWTGCLFYPLRSFRTVILRVFFLSTTAFNSNCTALGYSITPLTVSCVSKRLLVLLRSFFRSRTTKYDNGWIYL